MDNLGNYWPGGSFNQIAINRTRGYLVPKAVCNVFGEWDPPPSCPVERTREWIQKMACARAAPSHVRVRCLPRLKSPAACSVCAVCMQRHAQEQRCLQSLMAIGSSRGRGWTQPLGIALGSTSTLTGISTSSGGFLCDMLLALLVCWQHWGSIGPCACWSSFCGMRMAAPLLATQVPRRTCARNMADAVRQQLHAGLSGWLRTIP